MKSLKVFFAVLVVLVATVFIYSCAKDGTEKQSDVLSEDLRTETRAGEPCEDANLQCNNVPWSADKIVNLLHPDYPGCTFQVKYIERICQPNGYDLQIKEWIVVWPGCQAWDDAINNATDVGLLLQKTEKQLMNMLVNNILKNVTNINPCGGPNTTLFGFSMGACIKYCIVLTGTQTTPSGEIIQVKYVKLPCGEACCRTTYEVCINPSGEPTIHQSWSQGTGNCNAQSSSLPCPLNTIVSTGCIPNCQGI